METVVHCVNMAGDYVEVTENPGWGDITIAVMDSSLEGGPGFVYLDKGGARKIAAALLAFANGDES